MLGPCPSIDPMAQRPFDLGLSVFKSEHERLGFNVPYRWGRHDDFAPNYPAGTIVLVCPGPPEARHGPAGAGLGDPPD